MNEQKYRYLIAQSAEGTTVGTIDLTKKEAAIVAYALDRQNWNILDSEPWSGFCMIDILNPKEIPE